MTNWSAGYVHEIEYTSGFYRELTPQILSFAALARNMKVLNKKIRFCELGCGQGFSSNLLAAANPEIEFFATDFNPNQISGAKALADAAELQNIKFYNTGFADFASETDLPDQFDIIALHGIYSWISKENREAIVDFLAQKLAVSGIVYISYNTLPGWASAMPLRRLLVDKANRTSEPLVSRIKNALDFAGSIAEQSKFFKANPANLERLKKLKNQNLNYLAHEYFNRDWTPFYMADVAEDLSRAKLSFMGSAHLLDHINAINLTSEQQQILAAETDIVRSEGLKDFLINQQFRRDIFIKGGSKHSILSSREAWEKQLFSLSTKRENVPETINGALGNANLKQEIYAPILDAFADGPQTLLEILSSKKDVQALGMNKISQALEVLVGSGHLQPCLKIDGEIERKKRTSAFNSAVFDRAQFSDDLQYLASPVTGGGIAVNRLQQLFLAGRSQGEKSPDGWVKYAWKILSQQNQKLIKDGKRIETEEGNISELKKRAKEFNHNRLSILKQLGIA